MCEMISWKSYIKGEASCYSWKLDRVQVKITDSHYINNFVDHVIFNNVPLLHDFDKIILFSANSLYYKELANFYSFFSSGTFISSTPTVIAPRVENL